MKKLLTLIVGTLMLPFIATSQTVYNNFVDGNIWVKIRPSGFSQDKVFLDNPFDLKIQNIPMLQNLKSKYGITKVSRPFYQADDDAKLPFIFQVEFSNINQVNSFLSDLERNRSVEYAEKVPLDKIDYTPNDPSYAGSQAYLGVIGAPTAWNYFNGNSTTAVVAIVDNAVKTNHADLQANIWVNPGEIAGNGIDDDGNGYIDDINGWDVADNDNNPNPPTNSYAHGTHCAGIAGARTDNNVGVAAIGFNIKIMAVKATANSVGGSGGTIGSGYSGIIYAAKSKAKVISCSWGGAGTASAAAQSVIDYAWNKGCIVVAAAGNDGNNALHYPAAYNNVYAVGNTQNSDVLNTSSCYGTWLDICAPGTNIYSTVPYTTTPAYQNMTGTSMACPLVAGLCGLMYAYNPLLLPQDVLNCISSTATNINAQNPGKTGQLGAGRINAAAAMACVQGTFSNPPVADFTSDLRNTCPGVPVKFTSLSYYTYNPTTYSWSFQGGTPATSTQQNPTVTWSTPGTYSVTLTVTNPNGSDVETKTSWITIAGPVALPLQEGFVSTTFPPTNWTMYGYGMWTRATNAGGFGTSTNSALFDNYNNDISGSQDELRTPKYNCSTVATARLKFDVAYARYDAQYSDTLRVLVSTDCGVTWTSIYNKGGTALSTAPDYTVDLFVPTSTQWRKDSIDVTSYVAGQANVMFAFQDRGWYGQGLYLDNINLNYTSTANNPIANFTNSSNLCTGSTVQFTDQSTNNPTSWNWTVSPSAGVTVNTATSQNPTMVFTNTGTYSVTLVSTNSSGSSNPVTQTIVVNSAPTVNVNSPSICIGATTNLSATGAQSYLWSTGQTTNMIQVTPTVTTTYTVTGTSNGCSTVKTSTVTVKPLPPTSVNDVTICAGSNAVLTATGATTYNWQGQGSTNSSITVSPTVTTNYIVTGTTNGCSKSDTATVTVNPLPNVTAAASMDTVCVNGGMVNLTGTPAGGTFTGTGVTGNSFDPTGLSGNQNITYTYTDANNCTNTASVIIYVDACTGVNELNAVSGLSIFPNPAGAEVFVSIRTAKEVKATISLTDVLGKQISATQHTFGNTADKLRFDLTSMPAGVYFIKVQADGKQSVYKLIKE